MSDDATSVSVGETLCATTNDYQIIRNHARGNSRANGGVGGDVAALFCRQSIFRFSQNSENQRKSCLARTYENQGTLGPSLALECKCAFGAKINFQIDFSLREKCASGALLWFQNPCPSRSLIGRLSAYACWAATPVACAASRWVRAKLCSLLSSCEGVHAVRLSR